MANPVKIEIQHFMGCPNSQKMIENTKSAIEELQLDIIYKESLVETHEKAKEQKFRGSPTLLVSGLDYEMLEEPEQSSLACRYYQNGIPSAESIKEFILTSSKESK